MREHMGLFRGKRLDNREWVEGNLLFDHVLGITEIAGFEYWTSETGIERGGFCELVDPDTVGECTSMCDKDGKLIFEGDILKGMRGLHRVYYDTSLACFEWAKINGNWEESFSGFADEYEIIGNAHDNPELMEGAGDDAAD